MFNLGDFLRQVYRHADEAWINIMGRPVVHVKSQSVLRGIYVLPEERGVSVFNLNPLDEMAVELGYHSALRVLKKFPELGDLLFMSNSQWKVINRTIRDDAYKGETRLVLTCIMYVESKRPVDPLYHEDIRH